jgi:D-sedoheptulose 7-phosphate isomerase
MDGSDLVRQRLAESIATARRTLASECVIQAVTAAEAIAACVRAEGKVLFFGNGGSSMDAGHLTAELLGRFRHERKSLPAISLPDQTAAMTAIGNDYAFDEVFARQIQGLGRPGDVAVALSTSGESPNVVLALRAARRLGLTTILLTGRHGGRAASVAQICIRVPADDSAGIQEACMHLGHSICELVEALLFPAQLSPSLESPTELDKDLVIWER